MNPYSYRRILAKEKSRLLENCWICDKLVDAKIEYPHNQEAPVFLHLSIDGFEPTAMAQGARGLKSRRAVPAGEVDFFFSDGSGVIVLEEYPQKQSPIQSITLGQDLNISQIHPVEKVNTLTVADSTGLHKSMPRVSV